MPPIKNKTSPETGSQSGTEFVRMAYIVMVTISTPQAAVVVRNPMFRQVRTARSLGWCPAALIAKIERLIAVSVIAIQRVTSGAADSQSNSPRLATVSTRMLMTRPKQTEQ